MTTITLKTSEQEKELLKEYATFNGMSLNRFIKTKLFEAIEDEYDYQIGENAYAEYLTDGNEGVSLTDYLKDTKDGE